MMLLDSQFVRISCHGTKWRYGKRNTNRRQTLNAASGIGGEVPLYGVPPSAVHA